jgi:hypothetical protein
MKPSRPTKLDFGRERKPDSNGEMGDTKHPTDLRRVTNSQPHAKNSVKGERR